MRNKEESIEKLRTELLSNNRETGMREKLIEENLNFKTQAQQLKC